MRKGRSVTHKIKKGMVKGMINAIRVMKNTPKDRKRKRRIYMGEW